MRVTDLLVREFLRGPVVTASPIPSSVRWVGRLVAAVPERGEHIVVELGPGTGPAAETIQRKGAGPAVAISREN
ncbi:hypothetical protein [Streptomyces albipurpureus]|uniref:SAM-dependent methyltransferase n=1 Tax=Streptomyces albipurpureus TaxID=2897419 RepID=A0ABT0UJ83_9ACTN|nr:hypothetical protein [Streptomyces sp. CWNU-1]MCM2388307.1 hypothetical protein [Streptomyces sp. CWNU-1]